MKTITAIEAQKRNPDRVSVFLDGQFAFGLSIHVAAGLRRGQQLTPEQLIALQRLDSVEKGKQIAVRLISLRPRSVDEVKRNLTKKGYNPGAVEEIVEQLQAIELLDDEAFARYWIEQRETFKPRGRRALRHELRLKGIDEELIELVVSAVDETDAARRAASVSAGRWSNLSRREFRVKLGRFLQRRGFDYGTIRQITDEVWQSFSSDSSDVN